MDKEKLEELLKYGKGLFRVYEDDRGNKWQILPQEDYMDMVDELSELRRSVESREYKMGELWLSVFEDGTKEYVFKDSDNEGIIGVDDTTKGALESWKSAKRAYEEYLEDKEGS